LVPSLFPPVSFLALFLISFSVIFLSVFIPWRFRFRRVLTSFSSPKSHIF
jgi:hypothetical protein